MKQLLIILLFAVALSTHNETDVPETTHGKWVEILEKHYNIFYASLPINLRKAVTLLKKHKVLELYIMKLEKLGEENAIKICPKDKAHIPLPSRTGYFNPMHHPETCKNIVNAIVNIIKRFKK